MATDGQVIEAEDLVAGETLACQYSQLSDHFGFFLALAGIETVKVIRENSFDIKATSRLNRLYVELIKDNPDWGSDERREDINGFMARLIFCFFAEDTEIFGVNISFTETVRTMSERDSSNTHQIIHTIFQALSIKPEEKLKRTATMGRGISHVNGGLFSKYQDAPKFSKISKAYLLHIGALDWTRINPDIFGSMIQAVTEDDERGSLGMHYTSVPNILKVLNPLFLDTLREKLNDSGENPRKLLNLRNRIKKIRIFDPACGSGNFLVTAYKELRSLEDEINRRRGEVGKNLKFP